MNELPTSAADFFTRYVPERAQAHTALTAGRDGPGGVACSLEDTGEAWTLTLVQGEVRVATGLGGDLLVHAVTDTLAFEAVVLRLVRLAEGAPRDTAREAMASRLMAADDTRVAMLRESKGTIALVATEHGREHRLSVGLGGADPRGPATCTLRCELADLIDLMSGKILPIQLLLGGQLVLEGNAQIVMALAAALG